MTTIGILLAVFSAIAGIVGASYSTAAQQQANSMNKELNEENREDQQQFSQEAQQQSVRDTEYLYHSLYSPAAKVKQLQQAGLSVGMMYGQGGVGGSSAAAPMAATPSNAAPVMNPVMNMGMLSEIGNLLNAGTNPLKTIVEAENTKKDTQKKEEETKNLEHLRELIDAQTQDALANAKLIEEKTNTEILTQNNIKIQNDLLKLQKDFEEQTFEDRKQTINEGLKLIKNNADEVAKQIELLDIDKQYKDKMYKANLKLMKAQENNYIADTALKGAQKQLTEAETKLTNAKTSLTHKQYEELEQQIKNAKKQYELMENEVTKSANEIEIQGWEMRDYRKGMYHTTHQEGINKLFGMVEDVVANISDWTGW